MDTPDQNLEKMAALGRVTRSLIHDFNNALASIMGHADFLIADLDEKTEQHVFAQNIKKSAQQLQDSLNQIKSFAMENKLMAPQTPITNTPSADASSHKPKSILLVEDREMVLHAVETMLQRDHHQVEAVTDALAALDMIREDPAKYDLLITDYCMPELNGKDLLSELRQDFKHLPVIIMSGDQELLTDLKKDKSNKNIFLLSKPITAQNLKQAVDATNNHKK